MQAVKFFYKMMFWLAILMVFSCQSKNQGYKISKFASMINSDSASLVVNVNDSIGEKLLVSAVKINNKKVYESDSLGDISFNLEEGNYVFTGLRLHYEPVKTDTINIISGDSIIVDFYLKSDPQPLYNKR